MGSKSLLLPLVLFAAFIVAGCSNSPAETEAIAVAGNLLGAWNEAWVANDADAIVALIAEDGSYVRTNQTSYVGREAVRGLARTADAITYADRGEGHRAESGSYVFPQRFEYRGDMITSEIEVELDGFSFPGLARCSGRRNLRDSSARSPICADVGQSAERAFLLGLGDRRGGTRRDASRPPDGTEQEALAPRNGTDRKSVTSVDASTRDEWAHADGKGVRNPEMRQRTS